MDPEQLYDEQAGRWRRREPNSLSDFTGRPAVFELCGDVSGLEVLDVGCGEGYCARELKGRGAGRTLGIELSSEMVELARTQERELGQGIEYRQGDVRQLDVEASSFDLVIAVFVFNYLSADDTTQALRQMRRALRPGGAAVFAVPHPAFPFMRDPAPPFFFDFSGRGYFSARDVRNEGEIHCLDGTQLGVQMVHKTFEDYFGCLRDAGFQSLPELRELRVRPEHLDQHPDFMGPLVDLPLHLAFRILKE